MVAEKRHIDAEVLKVLFYVIAGLSHPINLVNWLTTCPFAVWRDTLGPCLRSAQQYLPTWHGENIITLSFVQMPKNSRMKVKDLLSELCTYMLFDDQDKSTARCTHKKVLLNDFISKAIYSFMDIFCFQEKRNMQTSFKIFCTKASVSGPGPCTRLARGRGVWTFASASKKAPHCQWFPCFWLF